MSRPVQYALIALVFGIGLLLGISIGLSTPALGGAW